MKSKERLFNRTGCLIFSAILFIVPVWCVWSYYASNHPDIPKPFPSYPNATKVNLDNLPDAFTSVECDTTFRGTIGEVYTTNANVTDIKNFYKSIANNLGYKSSPGFNLVFHNDVTCFFATDSYKVNQTILLVVFDPDNKNDSDLKEDPLPLRSGERVIILVRGFTYFEP